MPKISGENYYVLYYNSEGKVNEKRNKGKLAKPTSADTLDFLDDCIKKFRAKYGKVAKTITMSQEMKDMIDKRVKGKDFLKRKTIVVGTDSMGLRTIHLTDIKEK